MGIPRSCVVTLALVAALLSISPALANAEPGLTAVSGGGGPHVWFVAKSIREPATFELCHHASDGDPPRYRTVMKLTDLPEAMAAWGDRLWLVMAADPTAERPRRDVFTLQIQRDEATGWYYPSPRGRMEVVAPLTARGELAGFLGSADGPLVLIRPEQWATSGVRGTETSAAAQPTLSEPLLMQLQADNWLDRELPAGLAADCVARLISGGLDGQSVRILNEADAKERVTQVWQWDPIARGWEETSLPLSFARIGPACLVDGRPVLSLVDPAFPETIQLVYLRRAGLLPLAEITVPEGAWTLLGMADYLRLMHRDATGALFVSPVDAITGVEGEPQPLRPYSVAVGGAVQMLVLLGVLAAALLLVFMARPALKQPFDVPAGMYVLPIGGRLSALGIDLAAGGMLAVLITGCPVAALLKLPMWTPRVADATPFLIMAGATIVHSMVCELIWGTSLGKAIVGAKVVTDAGSRPNLRQVLLRGVAKAVILLMPPLGVFVMLNHNLQGLGDLLARTVVARPEEK